MSAFVFSKGWSARCKNIDCPEKLYYATPDKALAAASKRFMPNRSVEEIKNFEEKACGLWLKAFNRFEKTQYTYDKESSFASYLDAIHETRIADFLYGVSE